MDPFIMGGGFVGPVGFIAGVLIVLLAGWLIQKSGRG